MSALVPSTQGAKPQLYMAVREGFNGLPHYFLPFRSTSASGLQSTVVADGTIFTMANPQDPLGTMRAYELTSGKELLCFDEGGKLETPQQAGGPGHAYESRLPPGLASNASPKTRKLPQFPSPRRFSCLPAGVVPQADGEFPTRLRFLAFS
jgi:hypothetical protein